MKEHEESYTVLESLYTRDHLVVRADLIDKSVLTLYGRVMDDYKRWKPVMDELIRRVNPKSDCHRTAEERAALHPDGSPKSAGYKYYHHVHIDIENVGHLSHLLNNLGNYIPPELIKAIEENYNGV